MEEASGTNMVVMKYIENPLLSNGRKVDIRVWTLYTDWDPLTVWVFDDVHVRRASLEYDPDAEDRGSHLTNDLAMREAMDGLISKRIMNGTEFKEELSPLYGPTAWDDKVWPQMKDIIKQTYKAAQGRVEVRENFFHIDGFDFALDDTLNAWLLEVN